jgi:hypothetical protein
MDGHLLRRVSTIRPAFRDHTPNQRVTSRGDALTAKYALDYLVSGESCSEEPRT